MLKYVDTCWRVSLFALFPSLLSVSFVHPLSQLLPIQTSQGALWDWPEKRQKHPLNQQVVLISSPWIGQFCGPIRSTRHMDTNSWIAYMSAWYVQQQDTPPLLFGSPICWNARHGTSRARKARRWTMERAASLDTELLAFGHFRPW